MKRLGSGLLYGAGAYLFATPLSYFLVLRLSSNTHDRELEAAMSSIFFFGPVAALAGFVVGAVRSRRSTTSPQTFRG
jgi:hypothetical protein